MTAAEVMALIRASDKPFYVYLLCKPDGSPFYVGVGTKRRILDHALYARRDDLDSHKLRAIRSIWRAGSDIFYRIDSWCSERSIAERREAELIKSIGRRDLRTGPLSNITDGGEGASNPSDAARLRKSRSLREAWAARDKFAATAHLREPEVMARRKSTCAKLPRHPNFTSKGLKRSDENRAAISARLKANPISKRPDVRFKISAAKKGKLMPDHWSKDPSRKLTRGHHGRARAVLIDGERFACIRDAAEFLGVGRDAVREAIRHPDRSRRSAMAGKTINFQGEQP
jgi:hypothetical protein